MSQNSRNTQGEGPANSSRSFGENRDSSRYEGFEGMNYEQRRPLYSPQQTGNNTKENMEGSGDGKRRDEL